MGRILYEGEILYRVSFFICGKKLRNKNVVSFIRRERFLRKSGFLIL